MLRVVAIVMFLVMCSSCDQTKAEKRKLPAVLSAKVIAVKDGDTIEILFDGKPLRIRFAHIDCPEIRKKQPFGKSAKQFTSDYCFGKHVNIKHANKYDRYGRLIAEIILENGTNLNMELVKAGLAWHYKKHSADQQYARLENEARQNRVGLWQEPDPTPPWNWRHTSSPEKMSEIHE